ncbi:MAG TPA: AraC family transcriptional regulator [Caproiciproducens sp.]|nr:AraC family transcriptional regulator [Caproiciproducens sp.]
MTKNAALGDFTMWDMYEHTRDNYKYPTCWKTQNDVCSPHFHSSMEFVYMTDGKLNATLNGKPYSVEKGEILISSSYTLHSYQTENYSKAIILIVPLDFISYYNNLFSRKTFSDCTCTDDKDGEILHCMEMLIRRSENSPQNITNTDRGYIYIILSMLIERVGLVDIRNDQNRYLTRDILIYFQNNYRDPLVLEDLAVHFGYSKSRFSHIFNASFGCSIREYVNSLRCRYAANLLMQGTPMIDAAMSSGFETMRTFYRRFKDCYGMTPTQYCSNYAQKRLENPERLS